jgi:hypothetical protein
MKGDKGTLSPSMTDIRLANSLLQNSAVLSSVSMTTSVSIYRISLKPSQNFAHKATDMVLEDVTEFDYSGNHTKLSKILLNGNNICMVGLLTTF